MAPTPLGPFLDDPFTVRRGRIYNGIAPSPEGIAILEAQIRQLGLWDTYQAHLTRVTGASLAPPFLEQQMDAALSTLIG